ncbi:DUF1801 domain-containing protein (plasmid) [Arthrobacter agilis]|uniref:DUF1801 domain-containing protein n=1 Tax=Arthrobacter agilis TaxID=37921 RepID=UPI002365248D|nr:DUF1801 domain-containing protein [Arthrobacter agilis]WDF35103.1 DUF1801 domain-containing protein [Arthrobacter agilis]
MTSAVHRPTPADPHAVIAAVQHPVRKADANVLLTMMEEVTKQTPLVWNPSIIGFGQYHYRYASGHEGDAAAVGFSPRSAHLVLYGLTYGEHPEPLLNDLGKHRRGAGCLYVNTLKDIDLSVLRSMISRGYDYTMATLHTPTRLPGQDSQSA